MSELTTAQILGAYRRELLGEGFTFEQAEVIVLDAARQTHGDGIVVRQVSA